jgi:type I restriction enzyme, R subunit
MKIEWEYNLCEKPFCKQLKLMGWEWIEGDPDLPETTERVSSREVLLKGRLANALRKLNLSDAQPWMDDGRTAQAIRNLEQAAGHRLMKPSLPM